MRLNRLASVRVMTDVVQEDLLWFGFVPSVVLTFVMIAGRYSQRTRRHREVEMAAGMRRRTLSFSKCIRGSWTQTFRASSCVHYMMTIKRHCGLVSFGRSLCLGLLITSLAGVTKDDTGFPRFVDRNRFADLMRDSPAEGDVDSVKYPQIVSFIGETGRSFAESSLV